MKEISRSMGRQPFAGKGPATGDYSSYTDHKNIGVPTEYSWKSDFVYLFETQYVENIILFIMHVHTLKRYTIKCICYIS